MAEAIIGRVAVHVSPDLSGFYRETKDKLTAVEKRLKDLQVTFDVDLNLSETSKKRVQEKVDGINAKIDAEISETSARETQVRMAFLSRSRIATIYPKVDELAATKAARALAAITGGRAIHDMLKDFTEFIGDLDKALPKFAALSTVIVNIAGALMASTANMLSFGGSLATVAQSSLALPGILGGIAIGIGSTVAVLKDFNKELPSVANRLHKLQDSMSSKFWDKARLPIKDMIDSLFPQFRRGLNDTSTSLGNFFSKLSKSATGQFGGELQGMFNDLNESIDVSALHVDSFTGIIQKLGSLGAGQLPQLSAWVGKVSDQFNDWLGNKAMTGELQGFVDTGTHALKQLGSVLASTGSALAGLARAAEKAGGTTLDGLATSMRHVADVINGAAFQKAFTTAFRGADDAMRNIASRSGPAFESFVLRLTKVLGRSLPVAGDAAGKALAAVFGALDTRDVENTFVGMIESLNRAVTTLAPSMPSLAKAIAGVTRAGSALVESIAGTLAPVIDELGPKVASLADDLTPLIQSLGLGAKTLSTIASGVLSSIPNSVLLVGVAFLGLGKISNALNGQVLKLEKVFFGVGASARAQIPTLRQFGNALAFSMHPTDLLRNPTKYGSYGDYFKKGVGDNALKARSAVLSFAKSIGPAAGQAALLGAAASGLSEKLGITNTTTLTLAGSMIGPWGAAAGAAVGAFIDINNSAGSSTSALQAYSDALAANSAATRDNAIVKLEARKAELEGLNWIQKGIHVLGGGAADLNNVTFALNDLKDAAKAPSTTTSLMTMLVGPTGQITAAMTQAAAATKHFDDNLKAMNGTLSRREAWRAYKDSIAAVTQAAKDNGKTLNNNSAAGRANNSVLDNMASSAGRVVSTLKESGKARFLVQARQDFVDSARLVSDNEGKIQRLATKMFGFGKIKATAKVGVEDTTKGGKGTLPTLDQIFNKAKKLDGKSFKLFFSGNSGKIDTTMAGITKKVTQLRKSNVSIKFGAEASPVYKAVSKVQNQISKLNRSKVKTTFTIQDKTKPQFAAIAAAGNRTGKAISKAVNSASNRAGAMPGQFSGIGRQSMAGLAGGISAGRSSVVNAAASVVAAAIAAARAKAQIHSPSRVFKGIGNYITLGFAQGIKGGQSTVTTAMSHIIAALTKNKALQAYAKRTQKTLVGLAKKWEAYKAKIDAVTQYVASIQTNIASIGTPVEINGGSFMDITENLKNSVKDAQAFSAALTQLRDLKLNKTTMDQLAQAGPESALAAAQSIAQSGAAGIAEINKLQGQLATAASSAANAAADVVYNTGQNVAKGLLAGLKSGQKSIEAMMVKIATTMVQTIKRHLKIKSPSRVFKEIGVNTGKGFVHGVESQVAASEKAIRKLGAARPAGYTGRTGAVAMAGGSAVTKNLYYYAAPGSSIDAEEDLFSAFNRARSVNF